MRLINDINDEIFREYDLRGINQKDLNANVSYTIGKSFGSYIQRQGHKIVVVGRDNRISSPNLARSLIKGLISSGVDVIDLGLVTTPMFYFAKKRFDIGQGIMVTASHNPKEYNGYKISFSKIGNAYGPLIQDFKEFTKKLDFLDGEGKITRYDITKEYLEEVKKSVNLGPRKLKVVFDCGNGTGSIIIKKILDMFDVDYELLYCTSDPNFPNHIPDPAVSKNMIDLGKKVKKVKADFGIGIDGDADRVGVVDENGHYLTADLVMLIIYRYLAKNMKNKSALFDVKCSRTLIDGVKDLKLKPIMNRTGNSYCNLRMQEGNFDFGGEYSGHFFFRDKWLGFDDGIYAGLRIMEILSNSDKKFSGLLDNIHKYYSTEETKIPVTEENKFMIVDKVKEYVIYNNYKYEDLDGVRVEFPDGWALVRASNTGPNLTVRYEAKTLDRLEEIKHEFNSLIDIYK